MLNPITYTEKVVRDFLRYQLTTYPFADRDLHDQMRRVLSLDQTRYTPLMKGPYISLSRSFRQGAQVSDLVSEDLLHPHLTNLAEHKSLYGHQETALRAIAQGKTTLISTGTGSGKTECFLYPIISRCLKLRDQDAPPGIVAVIVYPMNALAEDQLGRLRGLLVGTGVTFGMYIGKTPGLASGVPGERLPPTASKADYRAKVDQLRATNDNRAVHPAEERPSREEMRTKNQQPRILLTNVKQLELLLTRQQDIELFEGIQLDYLVFDEAHTFRGASGAETACLVRRLRTFCGKDPEQTVCIATSATIADPDRGEEAGKDFAARFFGVVKENVALVGEEYEPDLWSETRKVPAPLPGEPAIHLNTILEVVSGVEEEPPTAENLRLLKTTYQTMTGAELDLDYWEESLYETLSANEALYQISEILRAPLPLADLVTTLEEKLGRKVPEEEVLCWLALGAAAKRDGRPLLRPIVHAFVRGVSGAVVTFPRDHTGPRLWLSAEDASEEDQDGFFRLPILTCTTCGQHYFEHFTADFHFFGAVPEGGEAIEDRAIWRPQEGPLGGRRLILLDRLVGGVEADGDEENEPSIPPHTVPIHFCRFCGTLHPEERKLCDGCGREDALVGLFGVRQNQDTPEKLVSCLSCKATGSRRIGELREPARRVRAVTVSDVHVLAQSMIQHAERRRLLVFTDNRQDAAFQAGWMADHARRFRLRALMYEKLREGLISIGDLTAYLDRRLDQADDLSESLIPEVWMVERKNFAPREHARERKYFLRILVLREVATGKRQRLGLEPWGRLKVRYEGLNDNLPFFQDWASRLNCDAGELVEGVACLLDNYRRGRILLDRDGRIFSRYWRDGDREVQRGYLPAFPGGPQGLKFQRDPGDDSRWIKQILNQRGDTPARQAARNWGMAAEDIEDFLNELWKLLTDELKLLVPVSLTGFRGRALPGTAGAHQMDADRIRLEPHQGLWRCNMCRSGFTRDTPGHVCMTWRCSGTLAFEREDPDNFDLSMLDREFVMIRPKEHSAQVPPEEREKLERLFKSDSEQVNSLVCTPTLELGVDIGTLDAVLMRNVPPLASNYWQRAGRAGRRHRMAMNTTYARPASHDRAYFVDPLKMLGGLIEPPSFNLRNDVMVRKHVHAAVLTYLFQLTREDSDLSQVETEELVRVLADCFPTYVKDYLFEADGTIRSAPLDVSSLDRVVTRHSKIIVPYLREIFTQGWPEKDSVVVKEEILSQYLTEMGEELKKVISRLWYRLHWAMDQLERLGEVRRSQGTLDAAEEALWNRCDRLIKKLKGITSRTRLEHEGYDDTYTYSVLAVEGFLPGYGLDTGAIVAYHQAPRFEFALQDFAVHRPTGLALREYVPGNVIYANGHRFFPRFFQLQVVEPTIFRVDTANQALVEMGAGSPAGGLGLSAQELQGVPVCDVDLPHHSQISDEEDYRFQLPVAIYGYEQPRHGEGRAFRWGDMHVDFRTGVHLRMVNVGPASRIRTDGQLGYPVCLVCGQSRSPYASQAELDHFRQDHRQRCGKQVGTVGFFADVVAEALRIRSCSSREDGYSVMESLRFAAARILEMENDDLQLLAIGRAGEEAIDMLLYDPMPGGSGLIELMLYRWTEIVTTALEIVEDCPSACQSSCTDCLLTFRNAYYHRYLNRHKSVELLKKWSHSLVFSHDIPAQLPSTAPEAKPVNIAESRLQRMLKEAGFEEGQPQKGIDLGRPLGTTTPDFFFEDPSDRSEGVCIYLDGLSEHIHGNPATRQRDRQIREQLRSQFYEVIEIPYSDLYDRDAMQRNFYRLGRILLGKQQAERIREQSDWFEGIGNTEEVSDSVD
ncbi:DEAD/DEAH box helicase [Acidobacteria bacterium AH-259-L09]|nr:DEAD/DEAH box helicase [Acidobacteria bacterium AH-259-L09]